MSSTAISAQGTKVEISTGSGSPLNISGVTVGFPTILTITAHGLSNGNVGSIAGLTGADAALLNGQSPSVQFPTTNTIAVNVDTTGKTITAGSGTFTPVSYTEVKNVKDFSGFDGQASELDKTNLRSSAKEFALGLVDNGQLTLSIDIDSADAGQLAAQAARNASSSRNFRLTFPDNSTASFAAYVKKFGRTGGVDKLLAGSIDLRISGAVTFA